MMMDGSIQATTAPRQEGVRQEVLLKDKSKHRFCLVGKEEINNTSEKGCESHALLLNMPSLDLVSFPPRSGENSANPSSKGCVRISITSGDSTNSLFSSCSDSDDSTTAPRPQAKNTQSRHTTTYTAAMRSKDKGKATPATPIVQTQIATEQPLAYDLLKKTSVEKWVKKNATPSQEPTTTLAASSSKTATLCSIEKCHPRTTSSPSTRQLCTSSQKASQEENNALQIQQLQQKEETPSNKQANVPLSARERRRLESVQRQATKKMEARTILIAERNPSSRSRSRTRTQTIPQVKSTSTTTTAPAEEGRTLPLVHATANGIFDCKSTCRTLSMSPERCQRRIRQRSNTISTATVPESVTKITTKRSPLSG
eukprot:m.14434 g.14434  ORF g.14434 m.14434 type:complete len:370 (-) comp4313_c0_seq1:235-1344(-)